jgi:hypothetical protein
MLRRAAAADRVFRRRHTLPPSTPPFVFDEMVGMKNAFSPVASHGSALWDFGGVAQFGVVEWKESGMLNPARRIKE